MRVVVVVRKKLVAENGKDGGYKDQGELPLRQLLRAVQQVLIER